VPERSERNGYNDGTISLDGKTFEVPCALIGKRVEVRFDDNLDEILIYDGETPIGKAKPVILKDNALVRREKGGREDGQPVSFHEALKRREDR
jgi:hypothetical protein